MFRAATSRRIFLRALSLTPLGAYLAIRSATATPQQGRAAFRRVRPYDRSWPAANEWSELDRAVHGRLSVLTVPRDVSTKTLQNPCYLSDEAADTEVAGWTGAWTSSPSTYVLRAETAQDVAHAVNFARRHRLRLVIKGGGHSYLGTSNASDSLLIWTRAMNSVRLHDDGSSVTLGAGALWADAYDEVTTKGARYVQGGGCLTVGVAGLIQSGGFGSFSKHYGLAAASLIKAEIVTADGRIRTVDDHDDADLLWALKGGGGGTFGVVTSVTLKTHRLLEIFGDVSLQMHAVSDEAYLRLIRAFLTFYATKLFGAHWGESVKFRMDRTLEIGMVYSGLSKPEAAAMWQSFIRSFEGDAEIAIQKALFNEALPARRWWDPDYLQKYSPGSVFLDDRAGASKSNAWWQGDQANIGTFLHGYHSLWLPSHLLQQTSRELLARAIHDGSKHWSIALHFNKGLAGSPSAALTAARDCATNPAVLDAFALAIVAGGSAPRYRNGRAFDGRERYAHDDAAKMMAAVAPLCALTPGAGSYVSESSFFQSNWRDAYWGSNYRRLLQIKNKYDPDGLFFVHHGVGSEYWSADGFTRILSD